ncbi:MAG TPA: GNAT family N-acetyltransferase [Noviherbaspirillum sp.]
MTEHVVPFHGAGVPVLSIPESDIFRAPVVISCHDAAVPPLLDAELRNLYGNIHSTTAHLAVYGGLTDVTHIYTARQNERPLAIFLFRSHRDTVTVINEGMTLDAAELERFTNYVFTTWRSVTAIRFHAVRIPAPLMLRRPAQHHACTAEIVMPLPDSVDAYLASLGRNMRRNLRRYQERLRSRHPSVRYDFYDNEDVPEHLIHEVIRLNRMRIEGKQLQYALDDEVDKLVTLVRRCGTLGVMTIDGKVVAGGIGYRVGDAWFFKVNAHDPDYNAFSAGILSCYYTICECIARGCREFNFMWNEYEYKFALGGQARNLHRLVIYRSRLQLLLHAARAMSETAAAARHRIAALLEKAHAGKALSRRERSVAGMLALLRRGRRMLVR